MPTQKIVPKTISDALLTRDKDTDQSQALGKSAFSTTKAFFSLLHLPLCCHEADLFKILREIWQLDESTYDKSFQSPECLQASNDLGFSGSTFFTTKDGKFIVKSVPRHFEHSFFEHDLLEKYTDYMKENVESLLSRILDFLEPKYYFTVAGKLGFVPTHHIVMENLLTGKAEAEEQALRDGSEDDDSSGEGKWETWDSKPVSYFYPERDIAGGVLASEATKSRLADKFDDKIVLSQSQANSFFKQLENDTLLLADANAVDYSLFLVRIPLSKPQNPFTDAAEAVADLHPYDSNKAPVPSIEPPFTPPDPPSWRAGIESADGKYVFRASILDFFWAKHKLHARCMTMLISCWNLVD